MRWDSHWASSLYSTGGNPSFSSFTSISGCGKETCNNAWDLEVGAQVFGVSRSYAIRMCFQVWYNPAKNESFYSILRWTALRHYWDFLWTQPSFRLEKWFAFLILETSRFFQQVTTREHSKKAWCASNYTRWLKTHLSRLQFGSLSSHTAYPFPNISGGIGGDAAAGWVMRSISVSEGSEGALTPVRLMARTRKRSSYNWLLWGKLPAISHNQNNQNGWNKFSKQKDSKKERWRKNPSFGIAINIKSYSYISCLIWSSHPLQSPHTRSLLWPRQKLLHVPPKLWQWWHCLQPPRVEAYMYMEAKGIHQSSWILRFYCNSPDFTSTSRSPDWRSCSMWSRQPSRRICCSHVVFGLGPGDMAQVRTGSLWGGEMLPLTWTSYCRFCINVQWPLTSHSRAKVNALLLRSVKK